MLQFDSMIGLTFDEVKICGDDLVFRQKLGKTFKFTHFQDCCESVVIEDVCGDLDDLVGHPMLMAEEVDGTNPTPTLEVRYESFTWTLYKFATIKGYVTVRWLGESNGCYSESVDFLEVKDD